jgi:hypothetical protein
MDQRDPDILAMILVLTSIRMEMAGRGLVAPILFAGALLSKNSRDIHACGLACQFPPV